MLENLVAVICRQADIACACLNGEIDSASSTQEAQDLEDQTDLTGRASC